MARKVSCRIADNSLPFTNNRTQFVPAEDVLIVYGMSYHHYEWALINEEFVVSKSAQQVNC